jgi:hypothetical protein
LLTAVCWFIEASTVLCSRDRDHAEHSQIFRSVAFTAACCYAKFAPAVLRCGNGAIPAEGWASA